jgi:hypothetical protein
MEDLSARLGAESFYSASRAIFECNYTVARNKFSRLTTAMKTPGKGTIKFDGVVKEQIKQAFMPENPCAYLSTPLNVPVKLEEHIYSFVILPIKMTSDGKIEQVGQEVVFCQTEAEMKETAANLLETMKGNLAAFQAAGWRTVNFVAYDEDTKKNARIIAYDISGGICFSR